MEARLGRYLGYQVREIEAGGFRVIVRKVTTMAALPLLLLAILLVRALRPLVVVRFGPLVSNRIGHFAANTEVYLCERDAGLHGRRTLDLFFHSPPVCNAQLRKMWDRVLRTSPFFRALHRANLLVPGGRSHVMPWRRDQDRDIHGLLENTRPHLFFTREEDERGRESLRAMGIDPHAPFVAFHARDSAYLAAVSPTENWRYQDYRDANIHNYMPAIEKLTARGYHAIRMGAVVREPLRTSNPRVVDYPVSGHRTEFLDIYLSAKCRFFISNGNGLDTIPWLFRRPVAYVNFVPFEYLFSWASNHLSIPKKFWLRSEHRLMTFEEILESGAGRFLRGEEYEALGIELVENSPEEIAAVVLEMDERLNGTWQSEEGDDELQRAFWSLFKPGHLHGVIRSRIGTDFLRQNRDLL